jgi:hypothetical protein
MRRSASGFIFPLMQIGFSFSFFNEIPFTTYRNGDV